MEQRWKMRGDEKWVLWRKNVSFNKNEGNFHPNSLGNIRLWFSCSTYSAFHLSSNFLSIIHLIVLINTADIWKVVTGCFMCLLFHWDCKCLTVRGTVNSKFYWIFKALNLIPDIDVMVLNMKHLLQAHCGSLGSWFVVLFGKVLETLEGGPSWRK
jgi:hypothetical protein